MKSLLLFLFLLSNATCQETKENKESKVSATIYLCDSPNAKKYHLKADCRGLSNCSYRIIKTSLDQAKREKKKLCGWEK
ncbi:hypothetical protein [Pedobacter sp. Hv1]|uniref:hypothetical protein n=1 Tax=Pedobacter sp. Hv1 TaxID=1740090 RepID=UPI0006D8C66A|nr:hypothetical protein [Pedobacter sp. Hv1]KQB99957.1 hypothetical protein AQF98_15740 [Pedobacter sp. Hv1]